MSCVGAGTTGKRWATKTFAPDVDPMFVTSIGNPVERFAEGPWPINELDDVQTRSRRTP
jgi:hypothetical protein